MPSTLTPLLWGDPPVGASAEPASRFQLPAGTVTFLLSDIEGSTRLWSEFGEQMGGPVTAIYAVLDRAIARYGGVRPVEQGEGDSVVAAFSRASDAVAAALQAQRELHAYAWPEGMSVGVRIALHTAEAQLRDEGNYFGLPLSRCARLRAIAHGGQILLSRTTRDLVADRLPQDVELLDCGSHRLRDLGRPEHVFALVHPDLDTEVGELRSLDAFANNLPDQLTSFVGRVEELRQLHVALADTRLLTLTGAGGVGKTRLALQLAADALERFPDGAWWVDLAPVAGPQPVSDVLAAVLGVRPLPGRSVREACCMHLAGRRAVVVLDNCEHLLRACAELVEALLRGCPQMSVIATSRTPLGVAGETDWRVPSLSLPSREPERETLESLGQCDAVRLFIERARKARPNFTVTNDNAPAVAQVCVELDGLPLAIELAAARVRMLSVEQIAAGLGDRFHLLTGGSRTALPRHQTLRASVDWSHGLLTEPEQVLLRRLAVFAGGFTLNLAEAVCADQALERIAILDVLASLVDKSLVIAEEHAGAVRYRLLETVRQYALERLIDAGEAETIRDCHRDAMLELAERIAQEIPGPAEHRRLSVLDSEAANFAAALGRALENDGERALRLGVALTFWWMHHGLLGRGERGLSRALQRADPAPSSLRARALWGRGVLAAHAGAFEAAVGLLQEAAETAEEVGDQSTLARAVGSLGWMQTFPDPVGSLRAHERSYQLATASGDVWQMTYARINHAIACSICGELDEADRLLSEALSLTEQIGSREALRWCWLAKSFRPLWMGDAKSFREFAERSLAVARDFGDPSCEGFTEALIGLDATWRGDPEAAIERLQASRERMIAAGAGFALQYTETSLAHARMAQGDAETARGALEAIVASGADFGWILTWATLALAELLRASSEASAAQARATDALGIAQRMQSPVLIAPAKELLGRLALLGGEPGKAEQLLHDALGTHVKHEFWTYVPQALDALAETAAALGSHEEAARILGIAQRARDDLGLARWPPDKPRIAQLESTLRDELGEEAFQAAISEGVALSRDDALIWIRHARGERGRPSRGWESLTPTELRVVRLIAEGQTNPKIAERMFISRGTVKVHLSHIFAKLNIASRAELAAEATRRQLSAEPSAPSTSTE